MNQFASLSAESEVSALAFISSAEVFTEQPAEVSAPRVNVNKLVLHNLTQPMHKRISHTELSERVAFARTRGNLVAMHAKIRAEVQPIIDAMRQREDALAAL